MSSLLIVVARAGMLIVILGVIALFHWPDIATFLTYFQTFFNMLYFLNPLLDMDTFFTVGKLVLAIQLIFLARKIIVAIIHFMSSGSFTGGGAGIDNSGGDV